jgi:hypothetical protein
MRKRLKGFEETWSRNAKKLEQNKNKKKKTGLFADTW